MNTALIVICGIIAYVGFVYFACQFVSFGSRGCDDDREDDDI